MEDKSWDVRGRIFDGGNKNSPNNLQNKIKKWLMLRILNIIHNASLIYI